MERPDHLICSVSRLQSASTSMKGWTADCGENQPVFAIFLGQHTCGSLVSQIFVEKFDESIVFSVFNPIYFVALMKQPSTV